MHLDFFSYLKRIELMAFFPGYVAWYVVIMVLVDIPALRKHVKNLFVGTLPYGYALVGALYLGLQLRNLNFDKANIYFKQDFEFLALQIWALLALFFWLPALARKPVLSFLHSLVYFLLIAQDLFIYFRSSKSLDAYDVLQNDMKLFTISLLLNILTFAAILAIRLIFQGRHKHQPQ